MSMKKTVLLAAAALSLVACGKTYELQETAQPKIGFGTWAETLTKATVENTFDQGATFKVWGFKTVASTNTDVFTGVTVTKQTAENNNWSYENKKYWDLSASSYTFYAVSPAADNYTLTTANGAVTKSPAITFTGTDSDILVADKTVVNKADRTGNFNSFERVNLSFNHVAALLDVKVKASAGLIADGAIVTVKSIQIQNIDSKGSFTVSGGYTTDPVTNVDWTSAEEDAGTYTVSTFDQTKGTGDSYALNTNLGNTAQTFINKLVVMPQDFRTTGDQKQEVLITYTIQYTNGEPTEFAPAAFSLTLFDNVDDADNDDTRVSGWAPGTHYIYTITIDANAINFTASIKDWKATENAYNYLVK